MDASANDEDNDGEVVQWQAEKTAIVLIGDLTLSESLFFSIFSRSVLYFLSAPFG